MTKIELSEELVEKLKKRMDNNRFESVDAYITYVLEQVLLNLEKEESKTENIMSKKEEAIVKERLKELGYL